MPRAQISFHSFRKFRATGQECSRDSYSTFLTIRKPNFWPSVATGE